MLPIITTLLWLDFNNGVLIQYGHYINMPAGTQTLTLPISFSRIICCVASRNTMNFSAGMTNILAGTPNLSTLQLNSGTASGYTGSMSYLCMGF